jgi:hypothetical protein
MSELYSDYKGEMCRKHWLKSLKVKDHLEDLGMDGKIIQKRILGK